MFLGRSLIFEWREHFAAMINSIEVVTMCGDLSKTSAQPIIWIDLISRALRSDILWLITLLLQFMILIRQLAEG